MLHDAFAAYETDEYTSDEEVTVHAHVSGYWHRRTPPDYTHTACGLTFNAMSCPLRREALRDPGLLCPNCFTPYELRIAAEHSKKQRDPGDKP